MRNYRVTGRIYNEEPHYYNWDSHKEFPVYDKVSEEQWVIQARSLKEAKNWFYQNHPEGVQGGSVQRILDTPSQDPEFIMFAIPSPEYGYGNFETVENRIEWAREQIKEDVA